MKTQIEQITKQINELDTNNLIALNNAYCREINDTDSEIFNNDDEFFDMFFEGKPNEAVRAAHFGDYNWSHEYVRFNGHGNLESLNYFEVSDLCEYPAQIAEYAISNQSEFYMLDFTDLEN